MPDYVWVCQVCAISNAAGIDVCTRCAAPAELSSIEIARRRRRFGVDASPEPVPGPIRRQIAKCRIWLPGIYVLFVGLAGLHVLFCRGDMCSLFLLLALLPWTLIPDAVPLQIREALPMADHLLLVLGFALNVALFHLVGRGIDAAIGRKS